MTRLGSIPAGTDIGQGLRRPFRRLFKFVGGSLADSGSGKRVLINNGGAALAAAPAGYSGIVGWTFTQATAQRLTTTDEGLPSGAAPRTMGAIIKPSGAAANRFLMAYGTASGEGALDLAVNTNGGLTVDTWTTNRIVGAAAGLFDGNPHLVAVVYDGGVMAIVVDGVVLATTVPGGGNGVINTGLGIPGSLQIANRVDGAATAAQSYAGDIWLPFVAPFEIDERDLTIASLIGAAS
jgi:hypothetical protein